MESDVGDGPVFISKCRVKVLGVSLIRPIIKLNNTRRVELRFS